MRKPKGRQGSWLAEWDGEQLPCVHKRWTKGTWPEYVDPGVDDRPEWVPFVTALSDGKKALLTTSDIPEDGEPWRRSGYVAVYAIDDVRIEGGVLRSEEHTSELQSLMRISYAVFCLKKKKK